MAILFRGRKAFLFFAVFFFAIPFIASAEEICQPHPSFSHYQTVGTCGGKILEIWADGCGSSWVQNQIQCGLAQTPSVQNGPACSCSPSSCYQPPVPTNITDPALHNVFEDPARDGASANPNNIKLPGNLGWNDVNDWAQKNSSTNFPASKCTVESYNYEITKTSDGQQAYQKLVDSPSTAPVLNDIPESCKLETSNSYQWHVKACNDKDGTNCTAWSQASALNTSSAPELMLPFDQDFEQPLHGSGEEPISLQWCSSTDTNVKTYELVYQGGIIGPNLPFTTSTNETFYNDKDQWQLFKDGIPYFWDIASCTDKDAKNCGIFSQLWSFAPKTTPSLFAPTLQTPASGSVINFSHDFTWTPPDYYASHFILRVEGLSFSKDYPVGQNTYSLGQVWNDLSFNVPYSWKIKSCGGPELSSDLATCTDQSDWSSPLKFTTTGAPPTNLATQPVELGKTAIPTTLKWKAMPGAASYAWEISNTNSFANPITGTAVQTEAAISSLHSGTTYFWRVKTCADTNGQVCGQWSPASFTTATLTAPIVVSPKETDDAFIPSIKALWNPVFSGNFYAYSVRYLALSPDEKSSLCKIGGTIPQKITGRQSEILDIRCMGQYQLQVEACVDANCVDKGPPSTQLFGVQQIPAGAGGLGVCGRATNNLATPWDDREPCQIKHAFLLLKTLIDFALWTLAPLIAILYAVATGAMIYFSLGDANALAKVKSMWKAVGIGVLILLFSWVFLNLLLGLLGFDITIFGKWYEIHV